MDLRAAAAVALRQGRPAGEPCAGPAGLAFMGCRSCVMSRPKRVLTIRRSGLRLRRPVWRALRPGSGIGCCRSRIGSCWRMCGGWRGSGSARRIQTGSARGCSRSRRRDPCTIAELLSGAREPMLARPALMNLLWAGDALVDVSSADRRGQPRVARGCGWRDDRAALAVERRRAADDRRRDDHGHGRWTART